MKPQKYNLSQTSPLINWVNAGFEQRAKNLKSLYRQLDKLEPSNAGTYLKHASLKF